MEIKKITVTDKLRKDIIERRKQESLSSYDLSEKVDTQNIGYQI